MKDCEITKVEYIFGYDILYAISPGLKHLNIIKNFDKFLHHFSVYNRVHKTNITKHAEHNEKHI